MKRFGRRRMSSSEGIVVTYEMRARSSLPSRADQQLVQITDGAGDEERILQAGRAGAEQLRV